MRYVVIHETDTDCFEHECGSAEECIRKAKEEWSSLTSFEKKQGRVIGVEVPEEYGEVLENGSVVSEIDRILWSSEVEE